MSVILPEGSYSQPVQIRNVIDVDTYHLPNRQLCPDESLLPEPFPPDLPESDSDGDDETTCDNL